MQNAGDLTIRHAQAFSTAWLDDARLRTRIRARTVIACEKRRVVAGKNTTVGLGVASSRADGRASDFVQPG